jgi:hypothetical protein
MFLRVPCLAFTEQYVVCRFLQARLGRSVQVSTSNKSTLRTRPGSKVCATFVTTLAKGRLLTTAFLQRVPLVMSAG